MLQAWLPPRQLLIRGAFNAAMWYSVLHIRYVFGSKEPVTATELCLFPHHTYWFENSPITPLCKRIMLQCFWSCLGMIGHLGYPILICSICVQPLHTFWKVFLYEYQCSVFAKYFISLAPIFISCAMREPTVLANDLSHKYCSPCTGRGTGPLRSACKIPPGTFDSSKCELNRFFCAFPIRPDDKQ